MNPEYLARPSGNGRRYAVNQFGRAGSRGTIAILFIIGHMCERLLTSAHKIYQRGSGIFVSGKLLKAVENMLNPLAKMLNNKDSEFNNPKRWSNYAQGRFRWHRKQSKGYFKILCVFYISAFLTDFTTISVYENVLI